MIFFNLNIEATLQKLLLQEDTDGDKRRRLKNKQINKFIENIKNVDFIDFFKNMIILIIITQNKYK